MSFWKSVRNVVDRITGDAAALELVCTQGVVFPGESIEVQLSLDVGAADLVVRGLYLDVEATEHVNLQSARFALDDLVHDLSALNTKTQPPLQLARMANDINVFRRAVLVSGPCTLGAAEKKSYRGQFKLPAGAQPTYHGTNVQHTWRVRARLDITGADPSTRWHPLLVGRRA